MGGAQPLASEWLPDVLANDAAFLWTINGQIQCEVMVLTDALISLAFHPSIVSYCAWRRAAASHTELTYYQRQSLNSLYNPRNAFSKSPKPAIQRPMMVNI